MKLIELKVARIGNSRGVRLPADSLRRYHIGAVVLMEERSDGILLRTPGPAVEKLSWSDTAREMAAESGEWNEWDSTVADGLDDLPLDSRSGKPRCGPENAVCGQAPEGKARMKRYEIRWASLDPTRGSEMAKTRPVVIVSLDELNERLQTVVVCPLTSQLHPSWRCRLPATGGQQPAEIAVDQIRTISKTRLGARIGGLTETQAASLRRLITEMYGE